MNNATLNRAKKQIETWVRFRDDDMDDNTELTIGQKNELTRELTGFDWENTSPGTRGRIETMFERAMKDYPDPEYASDCPYCGDDQTTTLWVKGHDEYILCNSCDNAMIDGWSMAVDAIKELFNFDLPIEEEMRPHTYSLRAEEE